MTVGIKRVGGNESEWDRLIVSLHGKGVFKVAVKEKDLERQEAAVMEEKLDYEDITSDPSDL